MIEDMEIVLSPLDAEAGPAQPINGARSSALVEAVLDEAMGSETAKRWTRPAIRIAAMAAAFLIGASGATAAGLILAGTWRPTFLRSTSTVHGPSTLTTPEAAPELEDIEVAPSVPKPKAPVRARGKPHTTVASPVDLLAAGNEHRKQKHWRIAEQLYRRAAQGAEDPSQAASGFISAAALRREHRADPKGALRLYRNALAALSVGPLSAEARWGISASFRDLGRTAEERQALSDFISHHPEHPRRRQAQSRLDELAERN